MKKTLFITGILLITLCMQAAIQPYGIKNAKSDPEDPALKPARQWVDSVFKTMSQEERIAQLIFIRAYSKNDQSRINHVKQLITEEHIGGIVFFQGSPVRQAKLTNTYQSISKIPLFISIDAEWGLGMRLDSVIPFPHQMMLGAIKDSMLIYEVGRAIGRQCKRIGVQINFAPVVDINNNPNNPVINDRSFGENKYRVADLGIQYMKGLRSAGVMACAKHFPGHGDTNVDSHKALPVINKSMAELKSLELYPFQQMINHAVPSIMVAHLDIPAIDNRSHRPMSLSRKAITGLLRNEMGYSGLVFTDALEMKGVSDYYRNGQAAVEALRAGDDVLLLPLNVENCIDAIKQAIAEHKLSWEKINKKVKKVLMAKYKAGLSDWEPVNTANLTKDLNEGTLALVRELDINAITALNNENHVLPFNKDDTSKMAFLSIGGELPEFLKNIRKYHKVDDYTFSENGDYRDAAELASKLKENYGKVILGIGNYNRYPARNYGLSDPEISLINQLQEEKPTLTIAFGNPYAIKHFCHGPAIIAAYNDSKTMQQTAADLVFGAFDPRGELPVTVCEEFPFASGLDNFNYKKAYLPFQYPGQLGIDSLKLKKVDSIAKDAIARGATPGCVILGMKNGKIFYEKAFGTFTYDKKHPVQENTIYDLASVTKVCATTMACMKLYDEGKLKLNGTLGEYLPWLRGTDKASLTIKDVMLHQAGFIPDFSYSSLLTDDGDPKPGIFQSYRDKEHSVHVAEDLYMREEYKDYMKMEIRDSRLYNPADYVYSDIDFQLMGYIVQQVTGLPLNEYVKKTFYDKLGMVTTGFRPRERFPLSRIAPTECEKTFREQCLHGDVHDPRSALFGEVAGHAGLFSDAYDLGVLLQMTLNGGTFDGVRYLDSSTINLFTAYQSDISRRGIGWDKRAKDQSRFHYPYPSKYCSSQTYGHYGYTGTCVWVDPKYNFVYVFLSNRVNPEGGSNTILEHLDVRSKVQDAFYEAMGISD